MFDPYERLAISIVARALKDTRSRNPDLREDGAAFFLSEGGKNMAEMVGFDGHQLYQWAIEGCPKQQIDTGENQMTGKNKTITVAQALERNRIEFGSERHIALLEQSYGLTIEKAKTIIKERRANPALWPYELYEKAEALLAQLDARPRPISTKKGWKRDRSSRPYSDYHDDEE